MFRKASSTSLSIEIGGTTFRFHELTDFEFALTGRTSLPPGKIAALVEMSDEDLLKQVEGIRQVERRFIQVLSQALEDATGVGPFLKELDLSMISEDNNWRAIIAALNRLDHRHEEYKRVALVKYIQYLTARQEAVNTIYATRHPAEPGLGAKHTQDQGPSGGAISKETDLFEGPAVHFQQEKRYEFARLPKGETVDLNLETRPTVSLRLGRHRFDIVSGEKVRLVDESGKDAVLRIGTNVVGRDAESDVVVDDNYRTVSRKHLIIQIEGRSLLRLTDISSLGTFMPPEYLDATAV